MFKKMIGGAGVLLLAGMGVTGVAGSALADPGAPQSVEFSHSESCGSVTLTVVSTNIPDGWNYGLALSEGVPNGTSESYLTLGSVVQTGSGTATKTISLPEGSYNGSADLNIWVSSAMEWDLVPAELNRHDIFPSAVGKTIPITVKTDCPSPITCESSRTVLSTNLVPNGWVDGQGAYVPGGYKFVLPGGSDWPEKTIKRDVNDTLRNVMANLDIKADSTKYVGLKFHTSMGVITFELSAGYNDSLWSKSAFPKIANSQSWYPTFAPVSEWVKEYPGLLITSMDVLTTSPDAGTRTIRSVSFGCNTYTFDYTVPTVQPCEGGSAGPVSTDVNPNGWTFGDTRTTGHNEYVAGGLHVWTEGGTTTDKAAGYHALSIPLGDVGEPSMVLTDTSNGLPSIQLGIDIDGNGTWDGYLVNEGDIYGHGNWWTNTTGLGVPAGGGYPSMGTLNDYLAANPNAKVISFGYSLGSGLLGSAVIKSITVGCMTYTFDKTAQPATLVVPSEKHDVQWTCGDTAVTQTWTISTTTYAWVPSRTGGSWVAGAPVIVDASGTRPLADDERCAVSTPTLTVSPQLCTATPGVSPGSYVTKGRVEIGGDVAGLDHAIVKDSAGNVVTDLTSMAPGAYTVEYVAAAGYVFTGDNPMTFIINEGTCPTAVTPVILRHDECGTVNGSWFTNTGDDAGLTWKRDGSLVTFTAADGYTIVAPKDAAGWAMNEDGSITFDLSSWASDGTACTAVLAQTSATTAAAAQTSATTAAAVLAATGSDSLGMLGLSGALLLVGGAFVALRTTRRRTSVR